MSVQLLMFDPVTLEVLSSAIFSPESADGRMRCNLLDGQVTGQSGPDHAHASHSPAQESNAESTTSATSGQFSSASSASAALQRSLESRLQARLGMVGSMEYVQTWRVKVTPAGRRYLAHTASARPISDKDCTGWPTPDTQSENTRPNKNGGIKVKDVAPSPAGTANLAGWGTPATADAQGTTGGGQGKSLRTDTNGLTIESSNAETASAGGYQLNPSFSGWLMGFPLAWSIVGHYALSKQASRYAKKKPSKKAE